MAWVTYLSYDDAFFIQEKKNIFIHIVCASLHWEDRIYIWKPNTSYTILRYLHIIHFSNVTRFEQWIVVKNLQLILFFLRIWTVTFYHFSLKTCYIFWDLRVLNSTRIPVITLLYFIMLSVNFFCNISSYDIMAYITKNYIALIYYAKIVHLLCQFHAGKVGFSAVCQAIYR